MNKIILRILSKNIQKYRIVLHKALSTNSNIKGSPVILHPVQFAGKGSIEFGADVQLGYFPSPFFHSGYTYLEARNEGSEITFGNNIMINNCCTVIAENGSIKFGNNVLIGTNVEIINSDFHHVHPLKRNSGSHSSRNICIGNNVFVGSNVKILKGVTVGDNSIISNGSVVFEDVPENAIARGNPASVIKKIEL